MIQKEIDSSYMEKFVPEDYKKGIELISRSMGPFYTSSDFEKDLELLLFFSRAGNNQPNPDALKRCRVIDVNAKRLKSGYGQRDALVVIISKAWIIKGGKLKEKEIKNPVLNSFMKVLRMLIEFWNNLNS